MKNEFYQIEEFTIDDIPILQRQIKSISLFVNIDKLGIELDCIFNDMTDIKATKPIKGGETVTLSLVDRYGKQFRKEYVLTSFEIIARNSLRDVDVDMKAISKTAFDGISKKLNVSYFDKSVSDIVGEILPNATISSTDNKIQLVVPGWSVTKTIEHLSRIAYSNKYGGMFLCWEDFDSVNFKSLNEVLQTQKTINSYLTNNRNPYYRYNIVEHKELSTGNVTKTIGKGKFNRSYASYDPETKTLITKDMKLADDGSKFNRLGKGQNFTNDLMDAQDSIPVLVAHMDDATMNAKYENELAFFEYDKKMQVLVVGDFTHNPGTLINIDASSRYTQSDLDITMGGIWMIEKVACHFVGQEFFQKIQLTRNAAYDYSSMNSKIVNPKVTTTV